MSYKEVDIMWSDMLFGENIYIFTFKLIFFKAIPTLFVRIIRLEMVSSYMT